MKKHLAKVLAEMLGSHFGMPRQFVMEDPQQYLRRRGEFPLKAAADD